MAAPELQQVMPIKADLLPYPFAKQQGVVIKTVTADQIIVAHLNTTSLNAKLELQRLLALPIQFQIVDQNEFNTLLTQTYQAGAFAAQEMAAGMEQTLELDQLIEELPATEDLLDTRDEAPIIRLLNALFSQAIKQQVSDIHVETFEQRVLIRFRSDGILHEVLALPRVLSPLIVSRIKVMAKLDIAEKRLPQDGRIALRIAGHTVDVRVSTTPTQYGERAVLRILDKQTAKLDLNLLGMYPDTIALIRKMITLAHGIILVTGPTGSGKTTSLYAMLAELNDSSRNILTVEDPIEYDLPGIGQTQVNTKVNMTFARGLRAMLRQDPDVVMVGEIRDLETAQVSVQASLTGHLVLSTLHTNSAIGAITRLQDMGVETFLLATSLMGLIAQRLLRVLCQNCKLSRNFTPEDAMSLNIEFNDSAKVFEPVGCDSCNQLGYKGRTGIYECIPIDETLRRLIHQNAGEHLIEAEIRKTIPSMRQYGARRVLDGITSIAEVLRVTSET